MADKHAFPLGGYSEVERGMTLRDWFAGQALSGIITTGTLTGKADRVILAYSYADAMLAERNKSNG